MALELPDDVLIEIMLRLPVKTVVTCRSLSKAWNHNLSKPDFCRTYQSRIKGQLLGVFQFQVITGQSDMDAVGQRGEEEHQPRKFSFLANSLLPLNPHDFMAKKLGFFFGSSGGLYLCGFHPMTYYVCNPITNSWVSLPRPRPIASREVPWLVVGIYCKEYNYTVVRAYVGGAVQGNQRGVVVGYHNTIRTETYSSETAMWTKAVVQCPAGITFLRGFPCTSVKGTFFWVAGMRTVVAYDSTAAENRVWVILMPPPASGMVPTLGESADGLIQCALECGLSYFRIYVLKRALRNYSYEEKIQENEWVLRHSVSFDIPEMACFRPYRNSLQVEDYKNHPRRLALHPKNPQILYLRVGKKILCLDFDTRRVYDVPYLGNLRLDSVLGYHLPCVVDYCLLPYFMPDLPLSPWP